MEACRSHATPFLARAGITRRCFLDRRDEGLLKSVCVLSLLGIASVVIVYSCEAGSKPLPFSLKNPYRFSTAEERLIKVVSTGFVRAIQKESYVWRECGKRTKVDDQYDRAHEIVENLYEALRFNEMAHPYYLWGTAATVWHESRGDPCAVGPLTRRWAVDKGLMPEDVHFTEYTRRDVKRIVNSRQWKSRRRRIGGDFGIGQNIWKKYAKMLDPETEEIRYATLDEILSVEGGAYVVGYNMKLRATTYKTNKPWAFWPGKHSRAIYPRMIGRIVNWMGGPGREMAKW